MQTKKVQLDFVKKIVNYDKVIKVFLLKAVNREPVCVRVSLIQYADVESGVCG